MDATGVSQISICGGHFQLPDDLEERIQRVEIVNWTDDVATRVFSPELTRAHYDSHAAEGKSPKDVALCFRPYFNGIGLVLASGEKLHSVATR